MREYSFLKHSVGAIIRLHSAPCRCSYGGIPSMKTRICTVLLLMSITSAMPFPAGAVLVQLGKDDIASALQTGAEQGDSIACYLDRQYSFGNGLAFAEEGVIRTKWYKLAMLAGLLAAKDRTPSEDEKKHILQSTELQIDVHTYGATIDFAEKFSLQILQNGNVIQPSKVSSDHTAYQADKKIAVSGFPTYRATVRAYFPYTSFDPAGTAQILLVKDGSKIIHEINLADYK